MSRRLTAAALFWAACWTSDPGRPNAAYDRALAAFERARERSIDYRHDAYDDVIRLLVQVDEEADQYAAAQALLQAIRADRTAADRYRLPTATTAVP
jgi:hypothetical protein